MVHYSAKTKHWLSDSGGPLKLIDFGNSFVRPTPRSREIIRTPADREIDFAAWTRERHREVKHVCTILSLPYIDSESTAEREC